VRTTSKIIDPWTHKGVELTLHGCFGSWRAGRGRDFLGAVFRFEGPVWVLYDCDGVGVEWTRKAALLKLWRRHRARRRKEKRRAKA